MGLPKVPMHISSALVDPIEVLRTQVYAQALTSLFQQREEEVYIAVALNRAESQVSSGEHRGHRLAHVAVVRHLMKIGVLKQEDFVQEVRSHLDTGLQWASLRVIAFVQEPVQGRILGAAERSIAQSRMHQDVTSGLLLHPMKVGRM